MEMTVKRMIEELQKYDGNMTLYFGGLDFYRLKDRGKEPSTGVGILQVEFNQTVYEEDGVVKIVN
ncbi:MAG: hypothetical protein EOO06_00235 [Chitinophagaceae bacterium]|nr:MAG: hypothetical protein EOO06_00235 [Chitinophagaceae bacterium]